MKARRYLSAAIFLGVAVTCSPSDPPATRSMRTRHSTPPAPPALSLEPKSLEPKSLDVLIAGLRSPDYATRLVATEALGCAPATVALGPLERQLGDPEPDVRAVAILALHKHPHAASRTLLRSVRDDAQEELSLRVLAAASLINPPPPCR